MFWLFLLLWLVYSQRFSADVIITGVIVSAILYWFMQGRIHHYQPLTIRRIIKNIPLVASYLASLVTEVVKSSINVVRLTLSRSIEIDPVLYYFSTDLKNRFEQVMLANAILLTPGTTVIGLEDGEDAVHALNRQMTEGMDESVFARYLEEVERRRDAVD